MGLALARLKPTAVVRALGYKTFEELCAAEVEISVTTCDALVKLVGAVSREDAIDMGQTRAMALLDIANATPEADTPAELFRKKAITLPDGAEIDPRHAGTRGLLRAARAIRAKSGTRPRRGRSVAPAVGALAERIAKAAHAAGLTHVRVEALATKPGDDGEIRISHVRADAIGALAKALLAASKSTR